MKITSATVALLFLILSMAFAADPEDLYTRTGTDPSPAELLANGSIVWGESFSTRTVVGSQIDVNHTLLEQQTGVLGSFSNLSGVHIPTSGRRTDYANITRWYQADGNTQIFRLFQGENNYRYDIPAEAPPSRVESVSPTLAVASGTWRVWEGTYTIINPFGSTIFQLFHEGSDLWSFHLGMSASGNISFNRRNSIAGLPDNITIAENMVGQSLAIKVRADGFNYEVYKKIPLVDADWILVTIGSYQQSPTNKVIFRWGMYPGSQPGTNSKDGLLFVTGARTSVSTEPGVPPPPPPVTYYRDHNGADAGFGTAGGIWAIPTPGDATQGWSADATGATEPVAVTTNIYDPVNFGTGATGLAAGTITVSGTVGSGNMTFASGSGRITLTGGTITLPAAAIIDINNNVSGGNVIDSVIGGAATNLSITGRYTLALNGLNTYGGQTILGDNTNDLTVRINSIRDVGGGASSLGAPTTSGNGLIQIGDTSRSSTLELTGSVAAQSTDRRVRIGSTDNGSGGAAILNNNASADHTLTFTNALFNAANTSVASSFGRSLTLGGSNPGANTIQGAIVDNGNSKMGLTKSGTGTWLLAGANTYSNSTNINAGTLGIGADHVLPNGAGRGNVNVNGGASTSSRGTLDLNGFDLAINGLAGSTGTQSGRVVNDATGTNKTLTVGNNNANSTFNGMIADNTSGTGTVALTKVGTGTQTLTAANTYTGATTVSGGTLALGAGGSINDSAAVSIGAGAILDTVAQATYAIPAGQPLTLGIDATDAGSSGSINAAELNISNAVVSYDITGTPDDPVYVLATYTSLTGAAFASVAAAPAGYALNHAYEGNKIALVAVVATPFETWAGGALFDADDNGDGISNGLAFLLGAADPDANALGSLPVAGESGGGLVLTFSMLNAIARGGATLNLQHSSDFGISDAWASVAVPDGNGDPVSGVSFTVTAIPETTLNRVVATLSNSHADGGKLFGRLKAENP